MTNPLSSSKALILCVALFMGVKPTQGSTYSELEKACEQADQIQNTPRPVTPMSQYIVPLMDATFGSPWCQCRNVGTSPHIGQDYYDQPKPDYSMAISNGTVRGVRFIQGCGWEVMFEDSHGALWRYLHLDKPEHAVGDQLWRGELMGKHMSYPSSSCGTGPHLHLERRSAGQHSGDITYKSCQRGRKTCYYDPVTMFRDKQNVRTKTERLKVVEDSKSEASQEYPEVTIPPALACPRCSSFQPTPVTVATDTNLPSAAEVDLEFRHHVWEFPARGHQRALEWSGALVDAQGIPNTDNLCLPSRDCVTRLEFYVEDTSGSWKRLYADASTRNRPLTLSRQAGYCWPAEVTGRYRMKVWTQSEKIFLQSGKWEMHDSE